MIIKRISAPVFVSNKEKVTSVMYWPLRPESLTKRTAKTSHDRMPQSLHTGPQSEKNPKGDVQ